MDKLQQIQPLQLLKLNGSSWPVFAVIHTCNKYILHTSLFIHMILDDRGNGIKLCVLLIELRCFKYFLKNKYIFKEQSLAELIK